MAEPFLGEIKMFGGNFAPRGWSFCAGQLLPISQNTALFSLLGTIYGGDGRTTFALPELRGRVPIHMGQGPGLPNHPIGQRAGAEQTTLTEAQIPAHNHAATLHAADESAHTSSPDGNVLAVTGANNTYHTGSTDTAMGASSISGQNTGGSQPHNNMQPYLAINFIIALVGIFPSRN